MRSKIIDKEIIITENNTINTANKKFLIDRLEYVPIGDTVYVVTATEKEGAKETPLDIMRRLIDRKTENLINEQRTCYLRASGGKK
ncbi:MAG: hypothetical protein J6C62_05525 [Clostridia bacterium]|nr:hypothetical protein [Clostridia bacterium]